MEKQVLVIAAMEDVELDFLKLKLENAKCTRYKGFSFFEGEMFGKSVVLCVSNIGLINAATCTVIGIEKYNPRAVINIGLAGGYSKDIHRGDIAICLDTINITSLECKGEGSSIYDYEITTFLHNEENRLIRQKADMQLVNKIKAEFKDMRIFYRDLSEAEIFGTKMLIGLDI